MNKSNRFEVGVYVMLSFRSIKWDKIFCYINICTLFMITFIRYLINTGTSVKKEPLIFIELMN